MKFFKKCINIILFILLLGILIVNLFSLNIYSIIFTVILLITYLLLFSKYNTIILNNNKFKIIFILIFFISIISRIILIETTDINLTSDFELYYNTALGIINENIPNQSYLTFNGYVYFFSYILSIVFKIFGSSIKVALYFNLFCQILTSFLIFKILKLKFNNNITYIGSILWILLPTTFFATFLVSTENLFLLMFILCIYFFYKYIDKEDIKYTQNIIIYILFGLLLAITNNIRPLVTISIIALVLYFIFTNKILKKYILLSLLVITYIGTNLGINNWIEHSFNTTLQSGSLEWSIYFGTNYNTCGTWNEADSIYAFSVIKESGSKELLNDAIKRFGNLSPYQKVRLGMCKFYYLWQDSNSTLSFVDSMTNYKFINQEVFFAQLSKIIVIILVISVMLGIFNNKSNYDKDLFIKIFIVLYILSNLFIVVNGRYNYILYPLLIILLVGKGGNMKEKLSKLVNVYKKYGFIGFCKKLYAYVKANYMDKVSFKVMFNKKKYHNEIKNILDNNKYDRIILWRSSFGYNVPLFQRPQHIANNLAKNKCLVFYEVTTMTDNVKILKKHTDNIYLINFNNKALNKILMQELEKINKPKYVQLYSTDWKLSVENIKDYMNRGFGFIYEYIDDISPELAGTKNIPQNIIDKYNFVMNNKDVYVIVTADKLKEDVISKRGKVNLAFSSNGVDYNFFKTYDKDYKYEKEFSDILKKKKPIIMYYGALAKWFDYDLVKKLAETDKYSIVLFGIKYDESFDENLSDEKNIYFMGPRDYKVLKNYAKYADVLTIPFVINNITLATSPVKIFEYMALHKPIVTTDMPECRKYKSVFIGKSHEDFIKKIDEAIKKKKDKKYIELLDKEAKENDWSVKAKAIIDLVKKDEK